MPSYVELSNGNYFIDFPENGESIEVVLQNGIVLDPTLTGWHEYVASADFGVFQEVAELRYSINIEIEDVQLALLQQSAPEWRDLSGQYLTGNEPIVATGSFTDTFGPGTVSHQVSGNGLVVVNQTTEEHNLHPGIVARTVVENSSGQFSVLSYGIGNSNNQGITAFFEKTLNNILGTALFNDFLPILQQTVANALIRDDRECFPAGTKIRMNDGSEKVIEDIRVGDNVLSFENGVVRCGKVSKLFSNITNSFVRLSFRDGRDDVVATSGHRFLTETGDYLEISSMLRLGGGTVRLVDENGLVVTAIGQEILYSESVSDMFVGGSAERKLVIGGSLENINEDAGWATFNFEVDEYHNYVAGGIRVHNDSVLSTRGADETLVSLSADLTDSLTVKGDKVIVRLGEADPYGDTQLYFQSGFADGTVDVVDSVASLVDNSPVLAGNPSALLLSLEAGLITGSVQTDISLTGAYVLGVGFLQGVGKGDIVSLTSGNDNETGTSGSDIIYGLAGNDSIEGGDGNDVLFSGSATTNYYGRDTLKGGDGNDKLVGSNGGDTIYGGAGDDDLTGGRDFATADVGRMDGGSGNDVVRSGQLSTPNVNHPSGTNYQLRGDWLYGGSGNDTVIGGAADDRVDGGIGDDVLSGGRGDDVFVFRNGFGKDEILDFQIFGNVEKIDLSGVSTITSWYDLRTRHWEQVGDDVVITATSNNVLTLTDISISSLNSGDFIF